MVAFGGPAVSERNAHGDIEPDDLFGGMTVGEFNMLASKFFERSLKIGLERLDAPLEPTDYCPGCGERAPLRPDLCTECLAVNT